MRRPTSEQATVIHHQGKHALVVAVAGSGKTETMVQRIVHLEKNGTDTRRLLILMFNKSAQLDFTKRLKVACTEAGVTVPKVRTFHAFGLSLCNALVEKGLIEPAELITDNRIFTIAREILEQVNTELSPDDQFDTGHDVILEFIDAINMVKETMVLADGKPFPMAKRWEMAFTAYERRRLDSNLRFRTFTDMLYDPVMAILAHPDIARFVANHYDNIIVDEFQDVNELQVRLLYHVAGHRAAIMAVGDEDQCIYTFRGARPDYMTELFEQTFPETTRYTLSVTFRYGHTLALMANHIIRFNKQRHPKHCLSAREAETNVSLLRASDSGSAVVNAVKEWQSSGRKLKDCAVLVHDYSHGITSETALMRECIPYQVIGSEPFFDRKEVLALRAAMVFVTNGWNEIEDPKRKAKLLDGFLTVPPLFVKRYQLESQIKRLVAHEGDIGDEMMDVLHQLKGNRTGYRVKRIDTAMDHVRMSCRTLKERPAAQFLLDCIDRLDLYSAFSRPGEEQTGSEKVHLINEVVEFAKRHGGSVLEFSKYLDEMSLEFAREKSAVDQVLITSIHRSKGLQWPHVLLPELAEAKFPGETEDLEGERRLFYVAITRAQDRLTLVIPNDGKVADWLKNRKPGHPHLHEIVSSRFIYESNLGACRAAAEAIVQKLPLGGVQIFGTSPSPENLELMKSYEKAMAELLPSLYAEQPDVMVVTGETVQEVAI